jgi:hypothetical protein
MAQRWYFAEGQQKLGPFAPSQLRQLVVTGRVQPTTMVLQEGTQCWVQADSIKGLFSPTVQEGDHTPPPVREASPERVALPDVTDILGAAKGLMKSVGKVIATTAQDAAASARQAVVVPTRTPALCQREGRESHSDNGGGKANTGPNRIIPMRP